MPNVDGKEKIREIYERRARVGLCLLLGLVPFLIGGCGEQGGLEQDIAALNSKLVVMEVALSERIAALSPAAVDEARQTMTNMLGEAHAAVLGLPQTDAAHVIAVFETLARFRKDVAQSGTAVSNALTAATNARREACMATNALGSVIAGLSTRQWLDFFDGFAGKTRETDSLLSGWRKQRLEKMENREFVTFPAFYDAAAERYAACGRWIDDAAAKQRKILKEVLPEARAAASNVMAKAGDVLLEHGHADEAIAQLRTIQADPVMVEAAREKAVGIFDGEIMDAVRAMAKWSDKERKFPSATREMIGKFSLRADALEANASKCAIEHADYMPEQCWQEAEKAAADSRADGDKVLAELKVFESGMAELQAEVKEMADAVFSARNAADWIRAMATVDEEKMVAHMAEIDAVGKQLETSKAVLRRKAIDEKRLAVEAELQEAREKLDSAEQKLIAATNKALSDEKAVKWEAEKRQMREKLSQIAQELGKDPPPGYTRPGSKVVMVMMAIDKVLAEMDSPDMSESALRLAVDKVQNDVKDIESRTQWTIGTRHPAKPHIHAAMENGKGVWSPDPGYAFDDYGENSDLSVHWESGQRHPDHSRVSSGSKEGTWDPAPGYKARWKGDLDPVWSPGERHPDFPHIHAGERERIWVNDPGYAFNAPNTKDLSVHWEPGASHPSFEGIGAARQEGYWYALPGWEFVHPGTSDLRARWVPGARCQDWPHIHASDEKWNWHPDDGYTWINSGKKDDFSVRWTPGSISADGKRRAGNYEGAFETRHRCSHCTEGYTTGWQKCNLCNGTGEALYRTQCPRCFGTRQLKATMLCTHCNGTGWIWY